MSLPVPSPEDPAVIASTWMKRGIARMETGEVEGLHEALSCFDQALAIRLRLPRNTTWAAYVLAASWMNRGDALTRLSGEENLALAVAAYDSALEALDGAPAEADPRYRRRHAIAWINRGIALERQPNADAWKEALHSIERGLRVIEGVSDETQLAACAWMNHANILLRLESLDLAKVLASAGQAIDLVASSEQDDPISAEVGLKARHVFCQATARRISEADRETDEQFPSVALQRASSALQLIRRWEDRGDLRFTEFFAGFFEFGALLVQRRTPDAILGFVREHLRPSEPAAPIRDRSVYDRARDGLAKTWRDLQAEGFRAIHTETRERWIETLQSLRAVEAKLSKA